MAPVMISHGEYHGVMVYLTLIVALPFALTLSGHCGPCYGLCHGDCKGHGSTHDVCHGLARSIYSIELSLIRGLNHGASHL